MSDSEGRRTRAVVWRDGADAVGVEEIRVAPPGPGEATIRVAACGVCHSDLSATNGTIRIPPPVVLGHEAAGEVVEVGAGVTGLRPGDHVVSLFVSMCGKCRWCLSGRPSLCDQASRAVATLPDGSVRTFGEDGEPLHVFSGCGVMAEFATLHVDNLLSVDRSVPLERAALLGCGVLTGVGAVVHTAGLEPGSSAAVFGVGGVGLNAVQGCRLAGAATVVAVDTSAERLETARGFGATHVVDASAESDPGKAIRVLTDGGVDYAFECVGSGAVVEDAYRSLGKGGTAVVVGVAPPRDAASVRPAGLTFGEKTITGSYFGSARPREDVPRILALHAAGRLRLDELVTRRYAIEKAPDAFADLVAGRNARGMIVFD